MDLTKENFEEALPEILADIKACDLIAIDTEFTGCSLCPEDKGNDYDSTEDRY